MLITKSLLTRGASYKRPTWDGHRDQLGQLAKVLSGGCEGELVARAVWTLWSQAIELENALEVREQHLDLLPEPARSAALP